MGQFWDFFKCRCHGNTMLAMKHGFLTASVQMLEMAQKLHRFGNDAAINTSKRIMACHQMPLPWRQIIRHQVSSIVCSSNILLLFQAFLLYFLHSSHIQAPSVHVSFQSKFFTFFLHITFQHCNSASAFKHKAFPLAISSGIAFVIYFVLYSDIFLQLCIFQMSINSILYVFDSGI